MAASVGIALPADERASAGRRVHRGSDDGTVFREAIERVELSLLVIERGRIHERRMTSAMPPPDGPIACKHIVDPQAHAVNGVRYGKRLSTNENVPDAIRARTITILADLVAPRA
jgi:hypothetical protein